MLEQVVQLLQQGIDPQTVVEQLVKSGVPEQEAVQTVQAIVQEMQEAAQTQGQQQQMPPQQQPPAQESPMMQMGGQGENAEIGVGNRLGLFMNKVSNMAADYQNKKMNAIAKGYAKHGGLVKYQKAGQYNNVQDYINANSLADDPYFQAQLQNDPKALESYLSNAYKEYYGLYTDTPSGTGTGRSYDPNADVYKNDPVYQALLAAYGPASVNKTNTTSTNTNTTTNTNNKNGLNVLSIDDVSALYTPQGRIRSKSMINGTRGRGRSNQYMWQTLFNTDNFAEAQRLAAQTGLKIDEGTAGLFGRRKKYSYEWGPGSMPGTPGAPGSTTPGSTTPGTATTPGGAPAGTSGQPSAPASNQAAGNQQNQNVPGMGFMERLFYRPGNRTSGLNRGVNPGTPGTQPQLPPTMTSQFDPTGYDANYSPMRNQIMQNRRRRMGEKLDTLYQRQADMDYLHDQGLSNRDSRKMARLEKRYNRSGWKGDYSLYNEPKKYGGLPMAAFGLFNKTASNENAPNRMSEKEGTGFAADYLTGMDAFQRNQNFKVGVTNFLNDPNIQQGLFGASDPMQRLYAGQEATYPERGIGRGNSAFTFNPLNMDTQPYKNGPAYFDNFAAPTLAPSFRRTGGSINQGDIRYMTDEEIAEFVANGGQVEYLD
jgi:hypothetical protein